MIQFLFSTSVDGTIKAWLYDTKGAKVDQDAPGLGCTRMAYSADGQRFTLLHDQQSFLAVCVSKG